MYVTIKSQHLYSQNIHCSNGLPLMCNAYVRGFFQTLVFNTGVMDLMFLCYLWCLSALFAAYCFINVFRNFESFMYYWNLLTEIHLWDEGEEWGLVPMFLLYHQPCPPVHIKTKEPFSIYSVYMHHFKLQHFKYKHFSIYT